MRYLIRISRTRMEDWVSGAGTPQLLAQNIFRLKKLPRKDICEESTYSVQGEVEEVQAAAAHLLTDQHRHALQHFLGLPSIDRPTWTRDVITCALTDSLVADLRTDVALTKVELAQVTVPEETIALRAFCLEDVGSGTGSADGDWDKALNQLRDEYTKHYLRELLGQ